MVCLLHYITPLALLKDIFTINCRSEEDFTKAEPHLEHIPLSHAWQNRLRDTICSALCLGMHDAT